MPTLVAVMAYWAFPLIAAIGVFFFVRRLTACWRLTDLPGVPPSCCAAKSIPASDLDGRTANFLMAQGMQVTEHGVPTGASDQTMLIVYSSKLCALRYLINIFGIKGGNQIVIKPDRAATVDIEICIGKDWIDKLPAGY